MASQPIYQFYAELLDYKPKIWRRFQVANNITMARLGYILMSMFEMQASHLFCFDVPADVNFREYMKGRCSEEELARMFDEKDDVPFGQKNWHFEILTDETIDCRDGEDEKLFEAAQYKIKDAVSHPKSVMDFNYDYGDDWHIHIVLEEIIIDKELPGKELPRVLEGEGYGIIEDCGGTPGLEEVAKAFKKKKGAQYKEYCEWLGRDDLDLAAFDIDDANLRLKKVPRIYIDIYEYHIGPSQKSIDFLERKYKTYKEPKKRGWYREV